MTCPCSQPLPAPGRPKAAARVRIDHLALRRELGGVPEIREAMTAKATGRPSANVGVIWQLLTRSVYKSGDLPWLATREAAQNAVDAARSAIRLRQVKPDDAYFAVEWNAAERVLVFDDPGVGMSADEIIGKFLAIGESGKRDAVDSGEAAGGFGVAKAVILGCSRSFVWRLHTRDNLAVANGSNEEVQGFDAPARQGTRLEIHDVDPDLVRYWDRTRGGYVGIAPVPDGLANVCVVRPAAGGDPDLRDPGAVVRRALMDDPLLAERFAGARAVGLPVVLGPLAVDVRHDAIDGLLLAGDAAGFVDPMTGDGLRFAVRGGELAAAAALDALHHGWSGVHARLADARRRDFAGKYRFNRALRSLVAAPRLVDAAAFGARLAPAVLRAVIARAGDCDFGMAR